MISQKAKYAMRALVALARVEPGTSLMIGEIAESQNIPKKFLEQILLDLKREGIVTSRRGKAGGYLMMRAPDAVSFGEVLRLIDGPSPRCPASARSPTIAVPTARANPLAKFAMSLPRWPRRRVTFSTAPRWPTA